MTAAVEAGDRHSTTAVRAWAESSSSDAELVELLAAQGFEGRGYERFEEALTEYALAVMDAWLRSGRIFKKVAEAGFPLRPSSADLEDLARDGDARDELADLTVALALVRFRQQAMIGGGWRPDGGRSLKSYFMGACLRQFPNEMRRFWRARQVRDTEYAATELIDNLAGREHALEEISLRDQLAGLDERTRLVMALTVDGYSQREIAELTETSVRAVEGVLYRWRKGHPAEGGDSGE